MSKRDSGAERRERLEAEQKAQRAEQRKRNLLTAGVGIAIGAVIIGSTVAFIANQEKNKPENKTLSAFGVSAADAGCDKVVIDKVNGAGEHVGPGTKNASQTSVKYATVPPSSGPHFPVWLPSTRNFYSVDDAPVIEQLVHNLEHGYSIVWYQPSLSSGDVSTLKDLSAKISADVPGNKFIVAPWDDARGAFPAGKQVAISHWGLKEGYRQFCGKVSGEAIDQFVKDHPASNSPEPNAA